MTVAGKGRTLAFISEGLEEIPYEKSLDAQLVKLCVIGNKVTSVSDLLFKLTNLTQLALNQNLIQTLPESIKNLSNLTSLNLAANRLTDFPEQVIHVTGLQHLYLENNQILYIPQEVTKLQQLKTLSLFSSKEDPHAALSSNIEEHAYSLCSSNQRTELDQLLRSLFQKNHPWRRDPQENVPMSCPLLRDLLWEIKIQDLIGGQPNLLSSHFK